MTGRADSTEWLAGQVWQAMEAGDLEAYADLLDPGVRWGAPGDPAPPCQSRAQVLAWYQRAATRHPRQGDRDAGVRRPDPGRHEGGRSPQGAGVGSRDRPVAGADRAGRADHRYHRVR